MCELSRDVHTVLFPSRPTRGPERGSRSDVSAGLQFVCTSFEAVGLKEVYFPLDAPNGFASRKAGIKFLV